MNVKELVKQFIPPFLIDLYGRVRGRTYNWNGIYRSAADVPVTGDGFNGEEFIRQQQANAHRIVGAAKRDRTVPTTLLNDEAFLPLLASVVRQRNSGRLRVVDFGGALGFGYVQLLSGALSCADIDYHVVELERACFEGQRLFPDDNRIHFHRALPERLPEVDIVYSRGALQYVKDYAGLVQRLCSYRARYVFLVWVPVGAFPTFASAQQNVERSIIAHWFLNFDELVRLVEAERYSLIFKAAVEDSYDQGNFPPERRLDAGHSCALLFENSEDMSPASAQN